jgi:threonine dehydrogenase-like Zn-dependent dehydrogenase
MQAVRKLKKGFGNVELVEVPKPEIGPTDILMEVWAAGVCKSDINILEDKHFYDAPVTLGHEYSGVAVEVGSEVKSVKTGDKLVADIEAPEGWIGVQIDGSYANYMRVPESVSFVCPADMSLDSAALVEPVVATIHCLQERSTILAGDFVAVIGPGPMGILSVQFAKMRGAKKVALIGRKSDHKRLEIGKTVGADYTLVFEDNAKEQLFELTSGIGADFVADCAGTQSGTQLAIDIVRACHEGRGGKGRIAAIAMWGKPITLDMDRVSMGQIDISGGWSWNGRETWEKAIDMLYRGCFDVQSMITSRYRLDEWETAFDNLNKGYDVKALIMPNQ